MRSNSELLELLTNTIFYDSYDSLSPPPVLVVTAARLRDGQIFQHSRIYDLPERSSNSSLQYPSVCKYYSQLVLSSLFIYIYAQYSLGCKCSDVCTLRVCALRALQTVILTREGESCVLQPAEVMNEF